MPTLQFGLGQGNLMVMDRERERVQFWCPINSTHRHIFAWWGEAAPSLPAGSISVWMPKRLERGERPVMISDFVAATGQSFDRVWLQEHCSKVINALMILAFPWRKCHGPCMAPGNSRVFRFSRHKRRRFSPCHIGGLMTTGSASLDSSQGIKSWPS